MRGMEELSEAGKTKETKAWIWFGGQRSLTNVEGKQMKTHPVDVLEKIKSGEGQPQRFEGQIESCLLTDHGNNFQEFSSEWSHVHAQDVAQALRVYS